MTWITLHSEFKDAMGVPLTGTLELVPAKEYADGLGIVPTRPVSGPLNTPLKLLASPVPYLVTEHVDNMPPVSYYVYLGDGTKKDVALADLPRLCSSDVVPQCACQSCLAGAAKPLGFTLADGDIRWQSNASAWTVTASYPKGSVVVVPDPTDPTKVTYFYATSDIRPGIQPPSPPWQQIAGVSTVPGATGATGPQGPPGVDGKSVQIMGATPSTPPNSPLSSQLWVVSSPPPSWVPFGSNPGDGIAWNPALTRWENVGPFRGPQGATGPTGATGAPGPTAVSASAGNYARLSPTDNLIYVPTPVIPAAGTVTPLKDGTAAVGSSLSYARENHVHPAELPAFSAANDGQRLVISGGVPAWQAYPVTMSDTTVPVIQPQIETAAMFATTLAAIPSGTTVYRNGTVIKSTSVLSVRTADTSLLWNIPTHSGTRITNGAVEVWSSVAGAVPTRVAVLSVTGTPLAVTAPQTGNTMRQLAGLGAWAVRVSDGTYGSIAITDQATQPGGLWSVAIGNGAKCVGDTSLALGKGAVAGGLSAISIMGGTVPQESIGIGTNSIVGNYCVGIGGGATTTGDQATAVGNKAKSGATGNAFGAATDAAAAGSVALGYSNSTYGAAKTTVANTVQMLGNAMPSGMGKVYVGPDRLVTLTELKAVVASAADFNDFKAKIAALS